MTIQTIFEVDTAPIDAILGFLESYEDEAYAIGQEIADETSDELLSRLDYYPPSVKYPIQWTSEKQRRWYFANNTPPYRRTYALRNSWDISVERDGGGFSITVKNIAPYAQFVVGSLARGIRNPGRYQQGFHANSGWPIASVAVEFWLEESAVEFAKRLNERFGDLVQSVTSGRRGTYTPRKR